jgi:anthranilate phosphoribosyltransferase
MPAIFNTPFKEYIKLVGRGQRSGQTLTQQQAYCAMSMIILGQATNDQRGAFLMLLRVREETPEELAGFVQAFREHTAPSLHSLDVDLDMGCYAGKRRHLPWFILAVMALTQSGKSVFLHGTHEPDSHRLYLNSLLPKLGFTAATSFESAQQSIIEDGFTYMELQDINPALDEIIQLRSQFGLRSCANTLARMLNPSAAPYSLQGVFHRHVDIKHCEASVLLKDQNTLCFRGEGGEIEFNPERDTAAYISRNGNTFSCILNAGLPNPAIKPKTLDPMKLVSFWQGDEFSEYGYQAVLGSLTIMCVLMGEGDIEAAKQQAKSIWLSRNPIWPKKLISDQAKNDAFATRGRHYAH